eukprot:CAMPEP_0116931820 /NCGR_PEP_ID=MMETSP0467-20121206/28047_1 /TAXON_ID=283647 /ORGANISM="Mesodinium pulex, Strain SPMC105" /LENGTH=41 /DNA_ID= /DNA_START= /DNA_END= /DNA_ORIENTATION=
MDILKTMPGFSMPIIEANKSYLDLVDEDDKIGIIANDNEKT